jgi:hypothetical protein
MTPIRRRIGRHRVTETRKVPPVPSRGSIAPIVLRDRPKRPGIGVRADMQPKVAIARLPGTARYRVVGRLAWYGAAGLFAHVADRGVAPLGSPSADRYLLRHDHNIWMCDHQGDRGEFCRSCLRRAGRSIGRLDEHEMRRRESRRLGRPVVGDDPGLRVLLTDLADARLTPIGRVWLRNELIRRDVTEAGLHDELRHRPDVIDTLVPRPLVVVGLPRTGTTLLHALLGCDPAAFVLPFWQQLRRPYPVPRGRLDRATRIVRAPAMASLARSMAPRLRDIHPVSSLRPEEDVLLLRDTGMLAVPVAAPGYLRWLQATRPRNTGPTAGTCRRCYAIGPDAAGAEVIVSSGSTWGAAGGGPGGDGGVDPP